MDWGETGRAARNWWDEAIAADRGAARATRARLRRAAGVVEVLSEPEVHELAKALSDFSLAPDRLALLARVLAHVDVVGDQRLARRMGAKRDDRRAVSETRFQRLIRIRAPRDLALPLIRVLPQVDRICDVAALAADLVFWGDKVRTRWCFDYFGAGTPEGVLADGEENG